MFSQKLKSNWKLKRKNRGNKWTKITMSLTTNEPFTVTNSSLWLWGYGNITELWKERLISFSKLREKSIIGLSPCSVSSVGWPFNLVGRWEATYQECTKACPSHSRRSVSPESSTMSRKTGDCIGKRPDKEWELRNLLKNRQNMKNMRKYFIPLSRCQTLLNQRRKTRIRRSNWRGKIEWKRRNDQIKQ